MKPFLIIPLLLLSAIAALGAPIELSTATPEKKAEVRSALGIDLSTIGGANKVPMFDANAFLPTGPPNADPAVTPPGGLLIPPGQRITWTGFSGETVGNVYMFANHGGSGISGTYPEFVWSAGRHCYYWLDGFQMGGAGTARGRHFLYMHSLGAATENTDPVRQSTPVWMDGSYWSGTATIPSNIGIQWVPSGVRSGELVFGISNGTYSNYTGLSGVNIGVVSAIPEIVIPFTITHTGPSVPASKTLAMGSGATIAFNDGTTMTSAANLTPRTGTRSLAAGTVTVSDASVTTYTNVLLTRKAASGTIGDLTYTVNPGVGFTINSSSATDASRVIYHLLEGTMSAAAPSIAGTTGIGDTLTATTGGGSNTFQWYSNGVAVEGATSATYVIRWQDSGLPVTAREDGAASNALTAWKFADEGTVLGNFSADYGTYQEIDGSSTTPATANSDPVGEWRNATGANYVFAPTTGQRPLLDTVTDSGHPFLAFDGLNPGDRLLKVTVSPALSRPQTCFMVATNTAMVSNERIFSTSDSSARMAITQVPDGYIGNISASTPMAMNEKHLVTARTTSTLNAIRVDAGSEVTATETTGNGNGFYIGGTNDSQAAAVRIYAVVFYAADLDANAQARVRAYLKAKWGTP